MMTHSSGLGRVLPFAALMLSAMLSACASHGNQEELQQLQTENQQLQTQNQQLQAQNQQLQAQIASLQGETRFVEAGDLLFPSGGYELSPAGKTELSTNIVPKLTGLQNAKVVVYGYTDSTPVGPGLKQQASMTI
jgi:Outer membrane protein and related peptidoglycan-associated (lipo)proteins